MKHTNEIFTKGPLTIAFIEVYSYIFLLTAVITELQDENQV
jgi:hypothetical protein